MPLRTRLFCVTVAIGAMLFAGVAAAAAATGGYVTVDFTGNNFARLGYVTYDRRVFMAQVGPSAFYVHNDSGSFGGLGQAIVESSTGHVIMGYSIDVLPAIGLGQEYRLSVQDPANAAAFVNRLNGRVKDLETLLDLYQAEVVDADSGAAFAAAVWEIVNETATKSVDGKLVPEYNLRDGAFMVRPSSGGRWDALANRWLNDLGADPPPSYALVSTPGQDFACIVPLCRPGESQGPPVPEPLTMASLCLAFSAVGVYIRRRSRIRSQVMGGC